MAEKLVFDVLAKASGAGDVKKLGAALDDVGKAADRLDGKSAGKSLFARMGDDADKASTSIASKLGNAFTSLVSSAAEAGKQAGSLLGSGIQSGLESLGPGGAAVGAGLFTVAIAAAPAAGALISAGLIAGIGTAGIGAGLALALQDPAIAAAAKNTGSVILDQLKSAAEPFKGSMLSALTQVRTAFQVSGKDIETIFRNLAPLVEPLTAKLGEAFNSITKGIADLSGAAGPVLTALGDGVALIGDVLGQGFSSMKDDGAAAAMALKIVFDSVASSINLVFTVLDPLVSAFGFLAEKGLLGPQYKEAYEGFASGINKAKSEMTGLKTETESATSAMQAHADQMRAATDPSFALITAQERLGTAQTKLNEATAKYGVDSPQATAAALEWTKASLGMADATAKAGEGFNGVLTPAVEANMRVNGASEQTIQAVKKAFADAAAEGKNYGKEYKAEIKLLGLGGVQGAAAAATAAINAIPSTKTITINAVGSGLAVRRWGGIDHHMAAGGMLQAHFAKSPTVLYGERATGGEAFIPKNGNDDRSRRIATEVVENWLGGRVSWGEQRGASGGAARSGGASAGRGNDPGLMAEVRRLGRAIQDLQRRPVTAISREGRNAQTILRTG